MTPVAASARKSSACSGQAAWARCIARSERNVALKILPESFADDADRLERFQREAEALAALNYPHIAHIHGFENSGPTPALVLELVDGPTLAERIARGPLLVAEVIAIAQQLAEALDAAHDKGIVHRDLKPANIKPVEEGVGDGDRERALCELPEGP